MSNPSTARKPPEVSLFPDLRPDDEPPAGPGTVATEEFNPTSPTSPAATTAELTAVALDGLNAISDRGCRDDLADLARFLDAGSAEDALRGMVGMGYEEGNRTVEDYRNQMMARGLSYHTVVHRLSTIRRAMKRARLAGRTTLCIDVTNPARGGQAKAAAFTPQGWLRLLAVAEAEWRDDGTAVTTRDLALILLLHDVLLHRGEVLALVAPDDFDPGRPAVRVPARVRGGGGARCWMPINERTRDALAARVRFLGGPPGRLFPMKPAGVNRVVRDMGRRAGIEGTVRPRDLRQAAIAGAIEDGRELREVMVAGRLASVGHVASLDATGRWFGDDEPHPLFTGPAGATPARPRVPPIVLGGRHDPPVVRGFSVGTPFRSDAQYDVVRVLLEAWPDGLTGVELVERSGHGAAVKVFHAVRASHPALATEILPPGGYGKSTRYRIRAGGAGTPMVQLTLFSERN